LSLFLTTQPWWAFASLTELRQRGVGGYVPFYHRDSSLVAPLTPGAAEAVLPLWTPADVWGLLLEAEADPARGDGPDATTRLGRLLTPRRLRAEAARWLDVSTPRRYSVGSEVWGETALHRGALRDLVQEALRGALPGWQGVPSGTDSPRDVRFLCKADARAALLGVRLASNLRPGKGGRPGALREHLACGLLVLAGAGPDTAVLDPFAGSGTILRAAWRRYGVRTCVGYEVDGEALYLARRAVRAPDTRLFHASFEACRPERLPAGTRLVSNLPFGVRYREVPTSRLVPFLARCRGHVEAVVLLLGREQGGAVADALGLGRKNVLVLGQPASVVHSPLGEAVLPPAAPRAGVRS
jgi:Putative RNA methylase family UPF0020